MLPLLCLSLTPPPPIPPASGSPIGLDLDGRGLRFRLKWLRDTITPGAVPTGEGSRVVGVPLYYGRGPEEDWLQKRKG